MSLIPAPSRPHLFAMSATAIGSLLSYNFGGLIVNDFILTNTDHVLICATLALLAVIALSLLLWLCYEGWRRTENAWVAVMFLLLAFVVPLGAFVALLLLQSLITSPFFVPNSANQVIYFLLLLASAVALLLAVSRRSIGLVLAGDSKFG